MGNLKITDRQISNLREDISRIHRQADLLVVGDVKTKQGKYRVDIIRELSLKIDEILKDRLNEENES